MLRSSCALFAVVASSIGISNAASGAILTMQPDKLTYAVGETVTLTVFGDSEGATTFGTFGRLVYSGALVDNGTRTQRPAGIGTSLGSLDAGDNGVNAFSDAFNRVSLAGGALPPGTLSTVTLIAAAVGVVDVNWNNSVGSGFELHYFGLTSAPGTSFSIVPEPATSALLVLGLLALAALPRTKTS